MKRIIIMGSPRSGGRSAHLAEMLFEANIDERPEDELFLVPVSEIEVGPCIACNACREKMEVVSRDAQGNEVRDLRHRCVFDDDMQALYDLIDDAAELTVVSPVFFSGAPSLLKALLDRLQPYYWANQANRVGGDAGEKGHVREKQEKRPATLHVIGEGGDPHGYDALVSEVKSALAVAGFRLERIFDWVGKINESGEITADAEEILLVQLETAEKPETSAVPAGASEDTGKGKKSAAHAGTSEDIGMGEKSVARTESPETSAAHAGTSEDIGMGEKSGRGAFRAPAEYGDHPGPQNPSKGATPHPAKPRPKLDLGAAGKQPSKRNKGKAKRRG